MWMVVKNVRQESRPDAKNQNLPVLGYISDSYCNWLLQFKSDDEV